MPKEKKSASKSVRFDELSHSKNKKLSLKSSTSSTLTKSLKNLNSTPSTQTTNPTEPLHDENAIPEDLTKRIASISNKLSESNIDVMLNELESIYKNFPKRATTNALVSQILKSVTQQTFLLDSFVMIHTGFLMCASAMFGVELISLLINQVVLRWYELHKEKESISKEEGYLLVLLGFIYNFDGISNQLIFDVFETMTENLSESQLNFLIRTIRLVGIKLHKEDPETFKKVTLAIHTSASQTSLTLPTCSLKFKFGLESLLEMTQTKFRKQSFFQIKETPLFTLCTQVLQKKGIPKWHTLVPTLNDILEHRIWWNETSSTFTSTQTMIPNMTSTLLKLAKKHHMNTDLKRTVFLILMSSEDYMDAYERLLKLGLKEKQEREIVRVLVHCAAQEKKFNAYYAHLSQKFCHWKHSFKITFQYTLWDFLKQEQPIKKLEALAHLYGYLVAHSCLTLLSILKGVNRDQLEHLQFLKQVVQRIQLETDLNSTIRIDGLSELKEMISRSGI